MRRWIAAAAGAACLALAGCGGNPGDLLGMEIAGGPLKKPEFMHVTADGRTSCNTGELHELPSATVLEARNVERDAQPLIKAGDTFPPAGPGRRTFTLKTRNGSVTWPEGDAGLPIVLPQAEVLALELEKYCPRGG